MSFLPPLLELNNFYVLLPIRYADGKLGPQLLSEQDSDNKLLVITGYLNLKCTLHSVYFRYPVITNNLGVIHKRRPQLWGRGVKQGWTSTKTI